MNIKAFFVLSTVLSLLLLLASMIDARKDLRDDWRIIVKNQDMPGESTQDLIPEEQASTISETKAYCDTHEDSEHTMEKHFVNKSFELMPDVLTYENGIKPKDRQRSFAKNFELRPDVLIDDYSIKPTKQKLFAKDLELRPDISIYDNDIKPTKKSSYAKDFELKADISIHEPTEQNSVVSSIDPQPDATIYHNLLGDHACNQAKDGVSYHI